MAVDISPRQRALQQIWNSRGPDDLLEIMAGESAARDPVIATELRNQSKDCAGVNQDLAERLMEMAKGVERLHEAVDQFAAVQTMADLLALHKRFPPAWLGKFNRLLGAFWGDSRKDNDTARQDSLRHAFRLLRDVYVAVYLIKTGVSQELDEWGAQIEQHPLLCDSNFHEFLDERFNFAAKVHEKSADGFAQMSSYIRQVCKSVTVLRSIRETPPTDDEVHVRMPLRPDWAELWFLVTQEFSMAATDIAREVNHGEQTLEAGIKNSLRVAPDFSNGSKEAGETFFTAAFLEHLLLIANEDITRQAISYYRRLADTGDWDSPEARATFILRYAKAFLNHWRDLADPVTALEDGAALISDGLPLIDENLSPRLMRDLFFWRARILENVGNWQPSAYQSAADDYARGLAVQKVKHELEARGSALTDLANTLKRIPDPDAERKDRKIIGTYDEALAALSSEERTLSRGLLLNSYAIYMNERSVGDPGVNQERALALAGQAIDHIERSIELETLDSDHEHVQRTLASAYLAKSNAIRKRDFGNDYDAYVKARELLRTGISRFGKAHDDQLRGIIQLNLGDINVELYSFTGDPGHARDALYAYEEAETLLASYPRDFSHALLSRAMIVTEVPECRNTEALESSLEAARRATEFLANANDPGAYARAMACLGELLSLLGRPGDFEEAIDLFTRAQSKYLEDGSYVNAITMARRSAAIRVQQYKSGDSIERVRQAKELLSSATQWVDQLWQQVDSVEWRFMISDRFSNLYAEIAWCQATLGDPADHLAFSIARAKGRELTTHIGEVQRTSKVSEGLGEYLDQLRVESRLAETARWREQRQATPDRNLDHTMLASQRALDDIAFRRRVLFPRPSHDEGAPPIIAVEAFLKTHPTALVCDITTSRWGTVVMLIGGTATGRFAGASARVLSLEGGTTLQWVSTWLASYSEYLLANSTDRTEARRQWADRTDEILQLLGDHLMQPALANLADGKGVSEIIIVPGRLAGLPIHAAPLKDGRSLTEHIGSVVYVPNIGVLSSENDDWNPPKTALCVLSDPREDLHLTAAECASVAAALHRGGADVKLIASVGGAVGSKALEKRGIQVPDGVTILDIAPTPQQISSMLPGCDHFFYSGHGVRISGQSGLILVDDEGGEKLWADDDVLATAALRSRPTIVLSACETATGSVASSELFDLTSSFLRIGARFVVGSLWVVVEDCAQAFTAEFYAALNGDTTPSAAFGIALRKLRKRRAAQVTDKADVRPDHPIYWAPFIAMRGM